MVIIFRGECQHEEVGDIMAWKRVGEIPGSNKLLVIDLYFLCFSKF